MVAGSRCRCSRRLVGAGCSSRSNAAARRGSLVAGAAVEAAGGRRRPRLEGKRPATVVILAWRGGFSRISLDRGCSGTHRRTRVSQFSGIGPRGSAIRGHLDRRLQDYFKGTTSLFFRNGPPASFDSRVRAGSANHPRSRSFLNLLATVHATTVVSVYFIEQRTSIGFCSLFVADSLRTLLPALT